MFIENTPVTLIIRVSFSVSLCLDKSTPLTSLVLWYKNDVIGEIL